ncbi:hypothetical protein EKO23_06335 [Nocardioides guangzhouensis]|uniref:Type VII secretion integral membrane protein EccD n=1 Tax=Nocardioides guangzhouensis TaxID=2497878 RepID=A0A4Q4ZGG3_9ACTN|nr:hypothetical protein [Nocardioides guangzhouensis]RYP87223.1 hypothetical protein EKO23_06335 [Nocardioides guangzhouensis]
MAGPAVDTLAVTVHGSAGALDLLVPAGASVADVAREYAAQCGLAQPPALLTSGGRRLPDQVGLETVGVRSGDLLVASFGPVPAPDLPAAPDAAVRREGDRPGPAAAVWCAVAALLGVLAAVAAAGADGTAREATIALLVLAALSGAVPVGRHAAQRAAAAPAFGGAAAFAAAYLPGAERLPLLVGIAGLGAAAAAGITRAAGVSNREVQNVWIATGLGVFVVVGGSLLAGFAPQVAWCLLLLLALTAARSVPALAVDVPDQMLIDLEKLAVTAWSARGRTTGRRGRMVIPEAGVRELLSRGATTVDAAAGAVLVVVLVSAPALLVTATLDLDRTGAALLVLFAGGGLLLAARSYRHPVARAELRAAGLFAWLVLVVDRLLAAPETTLWYVVLAALALAGGVLVAAIATGRGWRSVWWARRAEIGEALCGAFAVASFVVAAGLFRHLWELTSRLVS